MSMYLEKQFVSICIKKKIYANIAESCTGGLISSKIISVANASKALKYSLITYSNESKNNFLGIEKIIKKHGVVSSEVAVHMAKKIGYKSNLKNKISISCTGFASKTNNLSENQQGVVYIAVNYDKKINVVKKVFLKKNREEVINLTVEEMFKQGSLII